MKIERKRYVVMRNNRTEIWCGLAQNYKFKKIDDIGETPIKTYQTNNQAMSCSSWDSSNCGSIIPTDTQVDFLTENDNRFCYWCGQKMNIQ